MGLQDDIPLREHNNSFEVDVDTLAYFKKQTEFLNPNQSKSQKEKKYQKFKSPSENLFEVLSD